MTKFLRPDQYQRFPQNRREPPQQARQIGQGHIAFLLRMDYRRRRLSLLKRRTLATSAPSLLVKDVAENSKQPGSERAVILESLNRTERTQQRILNQIISRSSVANQKSGETAQIRQQRRYLVEHVPSFSRAASHHIHTWRTRLPSTGAMQEGNHP